MKKVFQKLTVKELIQALQDFDPELPVFTGSHDAYPTLTIENMTTINDGEALFLTAAVN